MLIHGPYQPMERLKSMGNQVFDLRLRRRSNTFSFWSNKFVSGRTNLLTPPSTLAASQWFHSLLCSFLPGEDLASMLDVFPRAGGVDCAVRRRLHMIYDMADSLLCACKRVHARAGARANALLQKPRRALQNWCYFSTTAGCCKPVCMIFGALR